jgi:hypothetical protein
MKSQFIVVSFLAMAMLLSGCEKQNASVETKNSKRIEESSSAISEETTKDNEEQQNFNPEGTYVDDMGSDLIISKNQDESYTVEYSIYKLTYMENATGIYNKDTSTFSFEGMDDNNNLLAADVVSADNHLVVTLTKSSYEDCPIGTSFDFYYEKNN